MMLNYSLTLQIQERCHMIPRQNKSFLQTITKQYLLNKVY